MRFKKNDSLLKALRKKAEGFSADEVIDEYVADGNGQLQLAKRKITTKYFPPDPAAIKSAVELEDDFSSLTDEELLAEKQRLLDCLINSRDESKEKE